MSAELAQADQQPVNSVPPAVKGRYLQSDGYVMLYLADGRVMREHRYAMWQGLGRPLLPSKVVHHRCGNRANNAWRTCR